MTEDKERYIIYIDNGGTFTDSVIVKSDGTFLAGKSPTTPDDLRDCFFGAIKDAAARDDLSLEEVISKSDVIGYGTTVGTNIIVSGVGGPKLGLITTKGQEDRTMIMRCRAAGLSRPEGMHIVSADKPKPLIPRYLIRGVVERVDCFADIIAPLDEDDVRTNVKELIDQGVEGIAVGFMWSFLNSRHELRVKEIIHEMAPDLPVSLSSEVSPTVREYPRIMSTIIDLYIGKALKELIDRIEDRLKNNGYNRPFLIMQAAGGLTVSKVVKPATTLHSGPVGGLIGVEFLKGLYGIKNAMGSDVGGTSFDVTISSERGEEFLRDPTVGRFEIANPMREIITIGAGGGTIARFDPVTKTLRVGPDSAGSVPGPVCYNMGGTEPTITDADVVMNRIDPNYFWEGKRKLDRDKAFQAIKEKIADPLNMDVMEAAEGICKIVDGTMQATLTTTMATKGVNPKDYVLFAFGGAGGGHCAGYSSGLGFSKVIIPSCASVFSAFGASTADIRHRYEASPFVKLLNLPYDDITLRIRVDQLSSLDQLPSGEIDKFNNLFAELDGMAEHDITAENLDKGTVVKTYEMLARYSGQLWEIRVPIPGGRVGSIDDLIEIIKAFEDCYIREYGEVAMVPRGGLEIFTIALTISSLTVKPDIRKKAYVGEDAGDAVKGVRDVYFNGRLVESKIYDMTRLRVGNFLEGPAIIEGQDTTIVLPEDRVIKVDAYENLVMEDI